MPSRAVSHAHVRALVTGTAAPTAGFGCEMLLALPLSVPFPGIVHGLDLTAENKQQLLSSNVSEGGVYAIKVCCAGETCIEGSRIWEAIVL